jgi:outer membrane protein OmpA-like peptidoglycan-associated protein
VGSSSYNLQLSRQRAESVAAELMRLGVPADRISAQGYGQAHPVASNASATDRAMNRRVEVYISNDAQPIAPRQG